MLKVLHYVSVMDRGGQETFIMNLFRKIDRNRIQFDFLCGEERKGAYDEEIYALGGKIYYLKERTAPSPLNHLQTVWQLCKFLRHTEIRYDVFHIHTHHAFSAFLSAVAAKMAGIKVVVVHSHNTSTQYHLRAHKIFKKLLGLLAVRRFACSEEAGHWLHGDKDFMVIHNGLDVDKFKFDEEKRCAVRKEMHWEGKKIVGHIGRFNGQKNHAFLIEIFDALHKKQPDAHLVLVGKGELEEKIREQVKKKGLTESISFLGVRDDVERLYLGMDLFLFPSLFEGLGIVLVEAQTADLPSVVSDVIPDEAIFLSNVTKLSLGAAPEVWAEECMKWLQKPYVRTDTVSLIRKGGYDIQDLADKIEKIYLMKNEVNG